MITVEVARGETNFKLDPTEILKDQREKTEVSRVTPRVLAQAAGKITVPFTEMGELGEERTGGEKPES